LQTPVADSQPTSVPPEEFKETEFESGVPWRYGSLEIMPIDDKALGPEEGIPPRPVSKNPLHGITLAMMLDELVAVYGWEEMGRTIRIRCFTHKPSISSSLEFLRKTSWARKKVEDWYRVTKARSTTS
jgi:hypothetical protein